MDLETVDLNVCLIDSKGADNKIADLATLVALELDYFAEGFVLHNITVGGELFLEYFQNAFGINILRKTLNGCQCLTTIALLNSDVNDALIRVLVITSVCKGIKGFKIVEGHKLLPLGVDLEKSFRGF